MQHYLIALGSNQRHPRLGAPGKVIRAAIDLMDSALGTVEAVSPLIESAPVGPSTRRYVNGALVLETPLAPRLLLHRLQDIEAQLGRERRGQRWRARTLDLDIVLWSGGIVAEPELQVPHPLFRDRDFVLGPAAAIAPQWRDPLTGLTIKQLHARLTRNLPIPR